MFRLALAAVLSLVLGIGIGLFVSPASRLDASRPAPGFPESDRPGDDAVLPAPTEPQAAPRDALRTPVPENEPAAREAATDDLLSRSLLDLAAEGLRVGWSKRRADTIPDDLHAEGMGRFEEAVLALPERIGVELADEQTAREKALADAAAGGAFAFIASLAEGGTPVPQLVTNAGAFEALLPRTTSGPTVHAESVLRNLRDEIEEGATISFPAGVFELQDLLGLKTPFPSDVTLTGAGMNSTLLVLVNDWTARSPVRRLEVRDCTIFTNDNYLIDQREGEVTMVLERIRVVGMDYAAGASCVFSFHGGAVVRARDCRFEGGYGDGPGSGQLLSFRSAAPVAARFERCTVSRIHLTIEGIQGGTTIVFDACRLDEMLTFYPESQVFDDPPPGLVLASGTTVTIYDRKNGDVPQLDLNDLFPGWKERMVQ
jgi:hypothetical protein